jgi:hypothetical protein
VGDEGREGGKEDDGAAEEDEVKPKQKILVPMAPERRLAVYARQRGVEEDLSRLTPRQRRRYLKKIPYWQRIKK